MAAAVEKGLLAGGTTLVEAGTEVGKSLAYLIPAASLALAHDKGMRVKSCILLLYLAIRVTVSDLRNLLRSPPLVP